jgi:hypothetical protein
MSAGLLTESSVLMCPHLGTVDVITSDLRVRAAGDAVLLSSDTFLVVGCTLTDSPCATVGWDVPAARSKALGDATLTEDSVGFCLDAYEAVQGTVQVVITQPRVEGE